MIRKKNCFGVLKYKQYYKKGTYILTSAKDPKTDF